MSLPPLPTLPPSSNPLIASMIEDARTAWDENDAEDAITLLRVAQRSDPDAAAAAGIQQLIDAANEGYRRLIAVPESAPSGGASGTGGPISTSSPDKPSGSVALDPDANSPYAHLRATGPRARFAPPPSTLTAAERQEMRSARLASAARRRRLSLLGVAIATAVGVAVAVMVRLEREQATAETTRVLTQLATAIDRGDAAVTKSLLDDVQQLAESDPTLEATAQYATGQLALLHGTPATGLKAAAAAAATETAAAGGAGRFTAGYARVLSSVDSLPKALKLYEQAFNDWGDPRMWLEYGRLLTRLKQDERAETILAFVVTNKEVETPSALVLMAGIAHSRGNVSAMNKLLARLPADSRLPADLAILRDSLLKTQAAPAPAP